MHIDDYKAFASWCRLKAVSLATITRRILGLCDWTSCHDVHVVLPIPKTLLTDREKLKAELDKAVVILVDKLCPPTKAPRHRDGDEVL
jgi:hypothetical protein